MKKLILKQRSDRPHWVGDGFPVRSIFTYNDLAARISPFLLMDYAGPATFEPTTERRGVDSHPHRGFETVTIVYSGEVEHRDSAGGGGRIGPGDVQWMTAASGLVHEEKHGKDFAAQGGTFEMVQLWVNLPAKDKMSKPRYQGLLDRQIPVVKLTDAVNGADAGSLRVIAGDFGGSHGPALTFTPINLWDLRIKAGSRIRLNVPAGQTAALFVLSGQLETENGESISDAEIALFEREGQEISVFATKDSKVLFLGGQPIAEPIVGYGPFVMNTPAEIQQAFMDFNSGKMGEIEGGIEGSE